MGKALRHGECGAAFWVQTVALCVLYHADTYTHLARLLNYAVCVPEPDAFHAHLADGLRAQFPIYPCAERPSDGPTLSQLLHLLARSYAAHAAYLQPPVLSLPELWCFISVLLNWAYTAALLAPPLRRRLSSRLQLAWLSACLLNDLFTPLACWGLLGSAPPSSVRHYVPVMCEALGYTALAGMPVWMVYAITAYITGSLAFVTLLLKKHGLAGEVPYALPNLWVRQVITAVAVLAFTSLRGRIWEGLVRVVMPARPSRFAPPLSGPEAPGSSVTAAAAAPPRPLAPRLANARPAGFESGTADEVAAAAPVPVPVPVPWSCFGGSVAPALRRRHVTTQLVVGGGGVPEEQQQEEQRRQQQDLSFGCAVSRGAAPAPAPGTPGGFCGPGACLAPAPISTCDGSDGAGGGGECSTVRRQSGGEGDDRDGGSGSPSYGPASESGIGRCGSEFESRLSQPLKHVRSGGLPPSAQAPGEEARGVHAWTHSQSQVPALPQAQPQTYPRLAWPALRLWAYGESTTAATACGRAAAVAGAAIGGGYELGWTNSAPPPPQQQRQALGPAGRPPSNTPPLASAASTATVSASAAGVEQPAAKAEPLTVEELRAMVAAARAAPYRPDPIIQLARVHVRLPGLTAAELPPGWREATLARISIMLPPVYAVIGLTARDPSPAPVEGAAATDVDAAAAAVTSHSGGWTHGGRNYSPHPPA